MIQIYRTGDKNPQKYESFKFSDGALQVKAELLTFNADDITIHAHLQSADDILELIMATDAVRRRLGPKSTLRLICPYLPYARQDRVMNKGEAHGLRVMCDLINSLNFGVVEVWDVHSDVALALLNNVMHYEQSTFVQTVPVDHKNLILVAPDAGAIKKTFKISKGRGIPMVRADKTRSVEDGSITGTVVYSEHVGTKNFLIVDDICDGGRTFIELAKELRKLTDGKVLLYVTHGIFSKGFEPFGDLIDKIFVANPFLNVDLTNPLVYKLNLEY